MSRLKILIIGVPLLLIGLLQLESDEDEEERVRNRLETGRTRELIRFIEKNYDDKDKRDLVMLVVNQMARTNMHGQLHELLLESDDSTLVAMIAFQPAKEKTILACIFDGLTLRNLSSLGEYERLLRLSIKDSEKRNKMLEDIHGIRSTKDLLKRLKKEQEDLKSQLMELSDELNETEAAQKSANELLASLVVLSGYIMSQPSPGLYFIALPSGVDAILRTTETLFQTEGAFSLQVVRSGTELIPYESGLSKQFDLFTEVSDAKANQFREASAMLGKNIEMLQETINEFISNEYRHKKQIELQEAALSQYLPSLKELIANL